MPVRSNHGTKTRTGEDRGFCERGEVLIGLACANGQKLLDGKGELKCLVLVEAMAMKIVNVVLINEGCLLAVFIQYLG